MKLLVLFLTMSFSFIGCTPKVTVNQIDRAHLNDYIMRTDRDVLANKMFDHAYYSREGSRGGRGIGGGGCGCN